MNKKICLVMAALVILCAGGLASGQAIAVSSYSTTPTTLRPGSDFGLTVTLTNSGTAATTGGLYVSIGVYDPNLYVISESSSSLGNLGAGGTTSTTFKLKATASGLYEVRIYVSGASISSVDKRILLQVQKEANFKLMDTSFSRTLEPGRNATVSLDLKNVGGDAQEVSVKLQPATGISVIGADEKYVGSWSYGSEKTLTYDIYASSTATSGVSTASLVVSYEDKFRQQQSDTLSAGIDIRGAPQIEITKTETDPSELKAGDTYAKLTLKVGNTGTDSAKYLKVSLNASYPFKFSQAYSQVYETSLLASGASADAIFYIDVERNASSGSYNIPVKVEFQDTSGTQHEETKSIQITIKEKPDFELVQSETTPKEIAQGSTVELRIKIRNTGNEKAESVSVRAVDTSEQPFDFDVKSDFIGNLRQNETGEAVLKLTVKNSASLKSYNLDTEVRCTGDTEAGDENVYLTDITVPITVSKAKGMPGFEFLAAFAAVLSVAYVMKKRSGL